MRKRGIAVGRCLSIRLSLCLSSVTLVHCIQTVKDIVQLLSRHGSPVVLICFESKRRYSIPKRTHSAGALNTRGWGKFGIFD